MSVYKSLTTSDVIVTPFKVNKSFSFQGGSALTASNAGIDRFLGKNIAYVSGSDTTGQISTQSKALIYDSVKQLYYSNFISGSNGSPVTTASFNTDGTITSTNGAYQPMYDNYLSNTLDANRLFPTASGDEIGVIAIPSDLFGEYIKPGTFRFEYAGDSSGTITDDGNGGLFQDGDKIGDIIYSHGIVIITTGGSNITGSVYGTGVYGTAVYSSPTDDLNYLITSDNVTCSFQSTLTIFESQYKCTTNPNEFTYTQNPSAISGSSNSGVVYDFLTGSYFQPYITTIGLYNNANELIAVGKLSQPLQSSNITDTTVLVNLDL